MSKDNNTSNKYKNSIEQNSEENYNVGDDSFDDNL